MNSVDTMVRLFASLFLISAHCVVIHCTKRMSNLESKPYGVHMCRELCLDTGDSFAFFEEYLSCHLIRGRTCSTTDKQTTGCQCLRVLPKGSNASNELARLTKHNGYYECKALHNACTKDNLQMVRYILNHSPILINCRFHGMTPVMSAATNGNTRVFNFLVSQGCDLSANSDSKSNVLCHSCRGGNLSIVRKLTEKIDINSRCRLGRTPLMNAVLFCHKDIYDVLVSKGGNVTVVDNLNDNILHQICMKGCLELLKHVLSQNILDIESAGCYGMTPMMNAVRSGQLEIVKYLLERGCNVRVVDIKNNNLLHHACMGGNVDMVKYILSLKIFGLEGRGFQGRTPLLIAAEMGFIEVFDFLRMSGCNVTAVDSNNRNIVHHACRSGQIEMVTHVLSLNTSSIESRGHFGRTPVMTAVELGHRKLFDFLRKEGCNLTAVDDTSNNIIHSACRGGHVDMVRHVLSLNILSVESRGYGGRTPVMAAVEKGQRKVFDYLRKKGCNMTTVDNTNNNFLHLACLGGHVEMVSHILSLNLFGLESRGFKGRTPVLIGVEKGYGEVFDFLRSEGCNLTTLDYTRNNILHMACLSGNLALIRYLVTLEIVDLTAENKYGQTPAMLAEHHGYRAVVSLLKANY